MMDKIRKILIFMKRCVTRSLIDNICLHHTNNKTTCHMPCKYARECDLHSRFFRLNSW